ncbi:hypothetical protein HanIR_Chr11g0518081 [Helianthus annuus]|nr:hypothetical protein HanIR_Chr11g0518081 [Helianthus annuus]
MNKRSKKAVKSNINTRKGINVACPTPPTASSQAKTREQKAEHAPCSASTGACPGVCRKDNVVEASITHHGGVPSGHGAVVNSKIRRILVNLDSTKIIKFSSRVCS